MSTRVTPVSARAPDDRARGPVAPMTKRAALGAAALLVASCLAQGCAVASATAGAAISITGAVVATGVSLTGKAIGAGIDAVATPSAPDHSGIVVRERIRPAPAGAPACPPATGDTPAPACP